VADQATEDAPILDGGSLVGAEGRVGGRVRIEVVDTDNLVIGARGQIFAVS
jgi:hypothetical protein